MNYLTARNLHCTEAATCSAHKSYPPDEKALGEVLFAAWQLCGDIHCLSTKVSRLEALQCVFGMTHGRMLAGVRILPVTPGRFSAGKSR